MESANSGISSSVKLFHTTVEIKEELDEKFDRGYNLVHKLISGLSDKEAHDALNNAISRDARSHEDITLGLIFIILTEPQNAAKSYRDLTLLTRDGFTLVVVILQQLVAERYIRLLDVSRQQIFWLFRELIRNGVNGLVDLCWNLLRNVAGGDISPKNLHLSESLLDIFIENRAWVERNQFLVASIVYSYLRIIEDHIAPHLVTLRQKEVTFIISLIRDKFDCCLIIGRDLIRLLQNVARIPEFELLWKDMFNNPRTLSPNFTGILQILQQRTSRRFLLSRLTPDMEKKIVFLASNIRFGLHKRHQDFFQRQYLSTLESQTLRCDLIRFIVCCIHPPNDVLCSDIIPRWAIIGWLLTTCTAPVAAANAKLALFYDWLFYDPEKDTIMNIEPAILVIHHSMRPHPAITATLLDFLCRIIPNFCPMLSDKVRAGIFTSCRQITEKRVVQSLSPIFDNPKLDRELRLTVREVFKEFCQPVTSTDNKTSGTGDNKMNNSNITPSIKYEDDSMEITNTTTNNHDNKDPVFSDEEDSDEEDDDLPLSKVKEKSFVGEENKEYYLSLLDDKVQSAVEALNTKDNEKRCAAMENIVQTVLCESLDRDAIEAIAGLICYYLKDQYEGKVLPDEVTEENIEESICKPLFVLFRNLVLMLDSNASRKPLINLVVELKNKENKTGYLLLYFIAACTMESGKINIYKEYASGSEINLIESILLDLKVCQEVEVALFCWLVPEVYQLFPSVTIGNTELLHLLLETVDAVQVQMLICQVLQGRLTIFEKSSFLKVLEESLEWETFEQCTMWHLIEAHNISIDDIIPILSKLDFTKHAEALSGIMLFLKQERPSIDLLKLLLCREVRHYDLFVVSILKYWVQQYEDKVADLMSGLLNKHSGTSPTKRKRGGASVKTGPGPPTLEQILAHLDQLRQFSKSCPHFFLLDSMQRALQQVVAVCSDNVKKRFSDLLALAEDLAPRSSTAGVRGTRNKTAAAASSSSSSSNTTSTTSNKPSRGSSRNFKDMSDSSEDSSEEEEVVKPKQTKKRKKTNPVPSDSD